MRWSVLFVALAACGGDSFTAKHSYDGGSYGSALTTSAGPAAPPEVENEALLLLPPAETERYVFVANPLRNSLTRVDVDTLDVTTTTVGSGPELVLTTPDHTRAVVLNAGDDTIDLVDAETLARTSVPVRPNLDAMALSPDGKWAVAWHDPALADEDDPPPGIQSFNEASFVSVADGRHFPMAVGFDPRMVRFTPDSQLAIVVSDAYLAKVDLALPTLVPELIELAPGDLDAPPAEEVVLAPNGSFAWVRQFGGAQLLVVDLETHDVTAIPAGDGPTDLDLSPDGSQAVAVARTSGELWTFDAADPFATPKVTPLPLDGQYGSLLFSPSGTEAVLYTTAIRMDRYAVWNLATDAVEEHALVKPVSGMAVTPTGRSLLVFHTLDDGPDTEALFAGEHALTLVDLVDHRSNPLLLPAEPLAYANSTTGERGYFVMDGSNYFEVLDYATLLHEQVELASPPEFLGVLPDRNAVDGVEAPAWVSQSHPLGRISFYNPQDGSVETLTGFELNAGIE